jgi:hypothetical protein
MKSKVQASGWLVRSVTGADGRRVIKLARARGGESEKQFAARFAPAKECKPGTQLDVQFADEAQFAFQPTIYLRLPLRRRHLYHPKGQVLGAW